MTAFAKTAGGSMMDEITRIVPCITHDQVIRNQAQTEKNSDKFQTLSRIEEFPLFGIRIGEPYIRLSSRLFMLLAFIRLYRERCTAALGDS